MEEKSEKEGIQKEDIKKEKRPMIYITVLLCTAALLCIFGIFAGKEPDLKDTLSEADREGTLPEGIGEGTGPGEQEKELTLSELSGYLYRTGEGMSFAYADITIRYPEDQKSEQTAVVSWKEAETAEEVRKRAVQEETGESESPENISAEAAWFYCQYQLDDDIHGEDIYAYLLQDGESSSNPVLAITGGGGTSYRFSQDFRREVIIKDGSIYALVCRGLPPGESVKPVNELFLDFVQEIQEDGGISSGWLMNEERLYWVDHKERVTEFDNPDRSFTEIRGRDINDSDQIMMLFGMVKDADYRIRISDEGPELRITFSFAQEIPKEGYETFLLNGFCTDELYDIKVTDAITGDILQTGTMRMCIEKPDTVEFADLDEDGYLDMQVSLPTHWNGLGAVEDEYARTDFKLWNPEEQIFESASYTEILSRRRENRKEAKEDLRTVIVKEGDCLWSIARNVYGRGSYYRIIYEENAGRIGEDPSLLLVGTELVIPDTD